MIIWRTGGEPSGRVTPSPPGFGGGSAAGPAGAQGAKGDPAIKLLVAAASDSLTAKAGAKVALRFAATADGTSTLTVKLGKDLVATVHAKAHAGKNTITWNGRSAKRGSYKLALSVVGADGQRAADTATLKLTASG